jgi:sugar (pentulose or hexulose) kinase
LGLIAQVGRHTPVVMTGGVAKNSAAVHFLAEAVRAEVAVPEHPQITGAYGAALLARDGIGPAGRGAGETTVGAREPARSCSTCEVAAGQGRG